MKQQITLRPYQKMGYLIPLGAYARCTPHHMLRTLPVTHTFPKYYISIKNTAYANLTDLFT